MVAPSFTSSTYLLVSVGTPLHSTSTVLVRIERANSQNLDRDHNPRQFSHWLKGHAKGESHGPGDSSTPRSERHTGLNMKAPIPASTLHSSNPSLEPTTPIAWP